MGRCPLELVSSGNWILFSFSRRNMIRITAIKHETSSRLERSMTIQFFVAYGEWSDRGESRCVHLKNMRYFDCKAKEIFGFTWRCCMRFEETVMQWRTSQMQLHIGLCHIQIHKDNFRNAIKNLKHILTCSKLHFVTRYVNVPGYWEWLSRNKGDYTRASCYSFQVALFYVFRTGMSWLLSQSTLQWRHNEYDGVSNHQANECLLSRLFKAQINENIKAPRHWRLWGEFTGDRWIPHTKGQ